MNARERWSQSEGNRRPPYGQRLSASLVLMLSLIVASHQARAVDVTNVYDNVTLTTNSYPITSGAGDHRVDIWTNAASFSVVSNLTFFASGGGSASLLLHSSTGYVGGSGVSNPLHVESWNATSSVRLVNSLLVITNSTDSQDSRINSRTLGRLDLVDSTLQFSGGNTTVGLLIDYNGGGLGTGGGTTNLFTMQNSLLNMGNQILQVGNSGTFAGADIQNSVITNLRSLRIGDGGAISDVRISNSQIYDVGGGGTASYSIELDASKSSTLLLDQSSFFATATDIRGFIGYNTGNTGIVTLVNGSIYQATAQNLSVGRFRSYGELNISNSLVRVSRLDVGGWGGNSPAETGGTGKVYLHDGTNRLGILALGSATNTHGSYVATGDSLLTATTVTLGPGVNSTGTFSMAGTTVVLVTNMTKTATITIGGSGYGEFSKNGGTLLADHISVGANGVLLSATGEVWTIRGNFSNVSTNHIGFNLLDATIEFTGGGAHTFDVAGADLGGGVDEFGVTISAINNFGLDALKLASASDTLTLNDPNGGGGALYLNALLLPGSDTNWVANISSVNGLNIYYRYDDPRSDYLNGLTYGLTGGGLLIGIPEPGVASLLALAALLMGRRRAPR